MHRDTTAYDGADNAEFGDSSGDYATEYDWDEIEADDPRVDYPWPSDVNPWPRKEFGLYKQDPTYTRLYADSDGIRRVAVTD